MSESQYTYNVVFDYRDAPTLERFSNSDKRIRAVVGPFRCLSGDTEILTPQGWVRLDELMLRPPSENGDLIAEFDLQTSKIIFKTPKAYIKEPCDFFYHLKNRFGIDQLLSPNHTVLFNTRFAPDKWGTITAEALAEKHNHLSDGWSGRIPTTFNPPDQLGLDFSDDEIRLIVAISADGNFPSNAGLDSTRCRITVRKERKKNRLRELLGKCGLEWDEANSPDRPTETRFSFYAPSRSKNLWDLFGADEHQLKIIVDEIPYWDGHFHEDGGIVFSTTKKENADFVQYAMACTGMRATIARVDYPEHPEWKMGYRVFGNCGTNYLSLRQAPPIERIPSPDGFQYCLTTESGFFVARRNGKIFITGNSGKSSACCFELYTRATQQAPDSKGVRRTRWAVVRNTYPELKDTTIKTFLDWFPPEYFGHFRLNPNPEYQMNFPLPDGTTLQSEFLFRALDKPEHVKNLLSLEVTGAWFNEAREIPKIIIDTMDGRINQYPAMKDGGATWGGMILDTNPCDTDHWFYKLFCEELPNSPELQDKYEYFHQPSGRSPQAENLSHLPKNYYQDFMVGKDADFVSVYVDGQYGFVREGKVIYTNYLDSVHCATEIFMGRAGLPLILGWDFGLTPACVISQYEPKGQWRTIHELCASEMGIRSLATNVVKPFILATYPGFQIISGCDPAGMHRSEIDENLTAIIELKNCGFSVKPAWTNALEARFSAIDNFLTRRIEGDKPAFQLSPECKVLRKGFNGEYKRRKLQVAGAEIYSDAPEKNMVSHPHEALQYAAMIIERGMRSYEKTGWNTQGAVKTNPPSKLAWA